MARGLSARQEAFCVEYIKTGNATQSYKDAGFRPGKEKSANEASSRLLASIKVQSRIGELRAAVTKKAAFTVDVHLRNLAALRDLAVKAGKYSPAVSAEVARGRASGFYIIERIPTPNDTPDPDEAARRMREQAAEMEKATNGTPGALDHA